MKKTILSLKVKKERFAPCAVESYKNYEPKFYNEKVVMRMSGLYGNFEKSEITNAHGVTFHKYSNIF